MTKVSNIKKEKHPDHQDYEFINPITNEVESLPRFLVRSRLAQWTHYISDEIKRLNIAHSRCLEINDHIDNLVSKEKEAKKDA